MFVSASEDDMRDSRPRTWAAVGTLFVEAPYGRNIERQEGRGLFFLPRGHETAWQKSRLVREHSGFRKSFRIAGVPHSHTIEVRGFSRMKGDTMSHTVSDDRHCPVEELVPIVDVVLILIRQTLRRAAHDEFLVAKGRWSGATTPSCPGPRLTWHGRANHTRPALCFSIWSRMR